MVPALDQVLTDAAEAGRARGRDRHGAPRPAERAGPHRGRHLRGDPGRVRGRARRDAAPQKGGSDDVKYHLGAEGTFHTPDGAELSVTLSPNPSHLEAVNPVVEGRARAQQTRSPRAAGGRRPPADAADPDPRRRGLRRAGRGGRDASTWRGWPATPPAAPSTSSPTTRSASRPDRPRRRSTTYSSDLAKGFDVPIIHVNADDPEACLGAARLAMVYRQRFHARRGDRPGRLPPLRPQRGRRARLHAAAHVRRDRGAPVGPRAVRQGPGRGRRASARRRPMRVPRRWPRDLAERQAAVRKQHAEPQLDRGADSVGDRGSGRAGDRRSRPRPCSA